MALSSAINWEVRTGGSDTNGGGFKAGASGSDLSQQDGPQYSVTDGVTNGTTTITSATANFGTDTVGNTIYVSGGTGSITAGWYEITSRTNSTTIVVDRSTGLTTGTGVTLKIGGGLLTPSAANAVVVPGNFVYVQAGTYSISSGISLTAGGVGLPICWSGYTSSHGDGGQATIQASTGITSMITGASYVRFRNLIIDANSQTSTRCILTGSNYFIIESVKVMNFTTQGINCNSAARIIRCWATGGTSAATLGMGGTGGHFEYCTCTANACSGFQGGGGSGILFLSCIAADNTGASSDGFQSNSTFGANFIGCVSYNNGRDGLHLNSANSGDLLGVRNCIFVNNAGYGINGTGSNPQWGTNDMDLDYNAFYNNTSGARNVVPAGAHSVTLTGDPFTNAGAGNFALNNTSGAGAACRAAGIPGTFQGIATTGYQDIGIQHQDSGSGGTRAYTF